jgi:phage repressor protein C with HTH and peptisase S24 domain
VITQAGSKVVRRLQILSDTTVRVSCDNRVYGPVDIDLASVNIVGRVVGRVTRI